MLYIGNKYTIFYKKNRMFYLTAYLFPRKYTYRSSFDESKILVIFQLRFQIELRLSAGEVMTLQYVYLLA